MRSHTIQCAEDARARGGANECFAGERCGYIRASLHAQVQASSRDIPVTDVLDIVAERLGVNAPVARSVAVLVGYAEGFRGASNGDVVWAIVRHGELATVMFRREDQPSTPWAFRVEKVVA